MTSLSDSSVTRKQPQTASLDAALEQALTELESDKPFDRPGLLARYPEWAGELNEFLDNWLAFEQKTGALALPGPFRACQQAADLAGKIIGDYRLQEVIGSGGMGIIYKAEQISLGRSVAVKMIINPLQDRDRFRVESEAAASLHHNNIVSIHEVGEFQGAPFISMQYIEGCNLRDHLSHGSLAPNEAARLLEGVSRAVHYAHQRGILHRDLKPANVLLDSDDKPYVTDFGLAKQMGNSAEITRSGAVLGTPGYMSPEQAMGQVKSITVAADVYGLGAILYATLTGNAPFSGDSDLKTLRRVVEDTPERPRSIRPELDRNIETICLKCLEKTPSSRYASAEHLADDLARYVRREPVHARPVSTSGRLWRWCCRNPAVASLSFLSLVLLCSTVVFFAGLAVTNHYARLRAEEAGRIEASLRYQVDRARVTAEEEGRAAVQALGELRTSNGLWASHVNLYGDALLWFTEAAKIKHDDPVAVAAAKTRCLSWFADSPEPVAAMRLASPFRVESFQSDMRSLNWRAGGDEILCQSGDEFLIWNYADGTTWRPADRGLIASTGVWSPDGQLLAIGCQNGEMHVLDADTRQTVFSLPPGDRVNFIAFTNQQNQIAVAQGRHIRLIRSTDGTPICEAVEHADQVHRVQFDPADRWMLTTAADRRVRLFDLSGDVPEMVFEAPCYMETETSFRQQYIPVFSQDRSTVFIRSPHGAITGRAIQTGQPFDVPDGGTASAILPSADARHWVYCGEGYARLWSLQDDSSHFVRHNKRLAHNDEVVTAEFDAFGRIATGSLDQEVRLWRVEEHSLGGVSRNKAKTPLAVIPHSSQVVRVLFAPDQRPLLATFQRDGLIRVWKLPPFKAPGYAVEVPPRAAVARLVDNQHWLVAGATHWKGHMVNASLRRIADGQVVAETTMSRLGERGHLLDSAVSPDRSRLVTLHAAPYRSGATMAPHDGIGGRIQLWKLPEARVDGPVITASAEPRSVAFHPDGNEVAVATAAMQVMLIDSQSSEVRRNLTPTDSRKTPGWKPGLMPVDLFNGQVRYAADGDRVVAWGVGKGLWIWDRHSGGLVHADRFGSWLINNADLDAVGRRIVISLSGQTRAMVVDLESGDVLTSLPHPAALNSVRFAPDGKHVLTSCDDGRTRVFDLDADGPATVVLKHYRSVVDSVYSSDGQMIATLSEDGLIRIWYSRSGRLAIKPLPVESGCRSLMFSADGHHLIVMGAEDEVRVVAFGNYFQQDEPDLHRLSRLAELVSGKTLTENGPVELSTPEWWQRWQAYSSD